MLGSLHQKPTEETEMDDLVDVLHHIFASMARLVGIYFVEKLLDYDKYCEH